jgi:predicted transcriptional regulator
MGALDNKTILFSGVFEGHDRKELEAQAEAAGAKLLSGVSKNLNYLVAGEKMGPQKKDKADELGVPIITLADFFAMLPKVKTMESKELLPKVKTIESKELLAKFLKKNYKEFSAESDEWFRFSYKKTGFQGGFNNDGFCISIGLADYYDHVNAVLKSIKTINRGLDKSLLARMNEEDAVIGIEAVVNPKKYSDELAKQMIEDIITVKNLPEVKAMVAIYGVDMY